MKKILMLAPDFFGYDKRIKNNFIKNGYEVKLYDDFSTLFKNSFIKKIIKKILKEKVKKRYFKNILKKEKLQEYEFCFVIKGDEIPEWFLQNLKSKKIKLVNYQWDDIERFPKIKDLIKYYDKFYTYSLNDSKEYQVEYLPFFYSDDISADLKKNKLVYIGTYRKERNFLLKEIYQKINDLNLECDFKIFINIIVYLKEFLFLKKKNSFFIFKRIEYEKTINIFSEAKAVIEILNKNQKTSTTRSIEAIGFKTKIITTYGNIVNYDFYHPNNYYILDDKNDINILHLKKWLKEPFVEPPKKIKEKYFLDNWIKIILNKLER